MDDPAVLFKSPIHPLLAAQPGRRRLQHVGFHADEGPRLQEAAQHEGRQPAETLRQAFVHVGEARPCDTYQVLPAASLSPKALKEPSTL